MSIFSDMSYGSLSLIKLKELGNYYHCSNINKLAKLPLIQILKSHLIKKNPITDIHPYLQSFINDYPKIDIPLKIICKNYGELLPPKIIDLFFKERNIRKPNVGVNGIYNALVTLEEIDVEYFETLDNMEIEKQLKSKLNLFLIGARMGFNMNMIEDYTHQTIVNILSIWKYRAIEKQILSLDVSLNIEKQPQIRLKEYNVCILSIKNFNISTILLNDLKQYPPTINVDTFKMLLNLKIDLLDILFINATKYKKYIPFVDKIFFLSRGYMYPEERKKERQDRLRLGNLLQFHDLLDERQKKLYYHIHGVQKKYDPLHEIFITLSVSSFDKYISICNDADEFAKNIGIIFPYLGPSQNIKKEEKWNYITSNIFYYTKLPERISYLEKINISNTKTQIEYIPYMTDGEILNHVKAFLSFDSRRSLVRKAIEFLTIMKNQFFLPTIDLYQNANNKETCILLLPVKTKKTYVPTYIGYGYAQRYTIIDIEELQMSFITTIGTGGQKRTNFRIPYKPDYTFTCDELEELLLVLKNFQYNFPDIGVKFNDLIKQIEDGLFLNKNTALNDYEKTLVSEYRRLTFKNNEKKIMRDIFYKIFECGMYMRRWKGPGNPYPVLEIETRDSTIKTASLVDPQENTTLCLVEIKKLIDSLSIFNKSFVEKLHILNWMEENEIGESILFALRKVGYDTEDGVCIRVYSSLFVETGYHYLQLFYNETIPGIRIRQMMLIQ